MTSQAPLLLFIEELPPDQLEEGSEIWAYHLAETLRSETPLLEHVTHPGGRFPAPVARFLAVRAAARRELGRQRPRAALYFPAGRMVTTWALLRARYLRSLLGAPVAMAAFHEGLPRSAAKWPPDLLLLTTEAACQEARRIGLKAEFVWTGADTNRFHPPLSGEKETLRRSWGIDPDRFVVLHVGHLFENRNLRALAALASEPGVMVLVLASHYRREPESSQLRRALEASGVCILEGHRPNVEELYRLADCYVFPTVQHDGAIAMPLSVVEARASGLPVVARRFRALGEGAGKELGVEVVESDEELGRRVIALRDRRLAPGSERTLADAYSWKGVARRVLELIDRMAEQTTR